MQPTFDFLSNGGEMGALMRARNWAATPLGPVQTWPDTLKTTVRLILTSNHPMFIWWGTDLIQFYNDGYRQTMGPERHPSALGQPGGECWAEIWPIIGPQIERVMAGKGATWNEEQLVPVTRHGRRQDVWWTYGYSPIESTDGVQGVLVVCNDVTEQHNAKEELIRLNRQLSEQIARRVQSEQHQAFQLELVDRLRGCTQSQEIAATAFALLGRHLQVSHVHYAEINEASGTFQIAHAWSRDDSSRIAGTSGVLDDFGPAIIAALRSGQIVPVSDILTDPRTAPYAHTYSALGSRAVVVVPIIKTGRFVATISLQQATSYEWTADQIALVEDVAERIWNAIAHARADEQHRADERAALRQRDAENERLRVLFRQAPGFMCILRGANHIFEFTNAAYMRLVGSERKLIGKPIREAFPELAGQGFFALLDQVFTTAKPFSASGMSLVLQPHPDAPALQTYVDFVYQPIIDENGAVSAIFVEGFDATEHYLAKAALQDSEARLKEGLRVARMVVWDWDLATERGKFSDNASAVFGADWAGITSLWESIHADDRQRLQHAHSVALEQCADYQELVRLIRPDNGALLWLQMHGQVVCGENGAPQAMRGIAIDVTERKSGEEALRDADRRKDEFLAMLAHELRNPLAPISAAAQLLSFVSHDAARVRQASDYYAASRSHDQFNQRSARCIARDDRADRTRSAAAGSQTNRAGISRAGTAID